MIGVAVNAPETPGLIRMRNRQATCSFPTLPRSIPLPGSARVEDRSPFGSNQSALLVAPPQPPQPPSMATELPSASAAQSPRQAITRTESVYAAENSGAG